MLVTSRSSCNELQLQWIGRVSASPWMIVVPVLWRKPSSDFMTKDLSTETRRLFVAFSYLVVLLPFHIYIYSIDTFVCNTSKYMILWSLTVNLYNTYIYIYVS